MPGTDSSHIGILGDEGIGPAAVSDFSVPSLSTCTYLFNISYREPTEDQRSRDIDHTLFKVGVPLLEYEYPLLAKRWPSPVEEEEEDQCTLDPGTYHLPEDDWMQTAESSDESSSKMIPPPRASAAKNPNMPSPNKTSQDPFKSPHSLTAYAAEIEQQLAQECIPRFDPRFMVIKASGNAESMSQLDFATRELPNSPGYKRCLRAIEDPISETDFTTALLEMISDLGKLVWGETWTSPVMGHGAHPLARPSEMMIEKGHMADWSLHGFDSKPDLVFFEGPQSSMATIQSQHVERKPRTWGPIRATGEVKMNIQSDMRSHDRYIHNNVIGRALKYLVSPLRSVDVPAISPNA